MLKGNNLRLLNRICSQSSLLSLFKQRKYSTFKVENQRILTHLFNSVKNRDIQAHFDNRSFEINVLNRSNAKQSTKKFPYIWLRDTCKCPKCFDIATDEKRNDLNEISMDIEPTHIKFHETKRHFEIIWSDGHTSSYSIDELVDFAFENETVKTESVLWNKDILMKETNEMKSFNYKHVYEDDTVLREAIKALVKYGILTVENIPNETIGFRQLLERICFLQKTLYGEVSDLTSDENHKDSAYLNIGLNAHNDTTYLKNSPG